MTPAQLAIKFVSGYGLSPSDFLPLCQALLALGFSEDTIDELVNQCCQYADATDVPRTQTCRQLTENILGLCHIQDAKRCGNCRYFEAVNTATILEYHHTIFQRSFHTFLGSCGAIKHRSNMTTPDPAATQDHEGYESWLLVNPNFGCVLHEPKEKL